jgi:small-conductance mechanosensitive channel
LLQQMRIVGRHLALRLGVMSAVVLGLCLISSLFGRATRRYVLDDRRKIQLRTIRKIVLSTAIALVVFLGFFTDFSSLATFAGLITAGLAVAFQTFLLSLVAFFHFFGAFGIRVGDRITISGVTGRVMQIGLSRFYLMELVKSDVGYLPTGRIVGFSNAVLFQPMPFFRQTPGTNFVWSEINMTLDPSVDYESAHKKIETVVNTVYAKQREIMRRQEAALFNITHFKAEVSQPQMYLKITGTGLLLTIRYSVQREQETELHLQMTEALLVVIRKDPELKIVNVG